MSGPAAQPVHSKRRLQDRHRAFGQQLAFFQMARFRRERGGVWIMGHHDDRLSEFLIQPRQQRQKIHQFQCTFRLRHPLLLVQVGPLQGQLHVLNCAEHRDQIKGLEDKLDLEPGAPSLAKGLICRQRVQVIRHRPRCP